MHRREGRTVRLAEICRRSTLECKPGLMGLPSYTARLARTADSPMRSSLFPRTHRCLPIASTAGVPHTLVSIVHDNVAGSRGSDVRLVVADFHDNVKRWIG